jgi:hypothetical protein
MMDGERQGRACLALTPFISSDEIDWDDFCFTCSC